MMKQCLLFDCDGTLVDSELICNIGLVIKFREYGLELNAEELAIRFRGWKLAEILKSLEAEYQLSLRSNFVDSYRQVVADLFETELKSVSHIEAALEELDQPKAVVSSGPTHKIIQALRVCGLTKHFGDNIDSSYEVQVWKPDPGIYQLAAKDMGFKFEECVVIDDSPVGVEAGFKAGMKTLFYNRYNEACEFESVISFTSMEELPRLVHT